MQTPLGIALEMFIPKSVLQIWRVDEIIFADDGKWFEN